MTRWLLIFVPVTIAIDIFWPDETLLIFIAAVLSMIPLSQIMGESTEQLSGHVGPAIGGFLNATFGNMAEIILMIALITKGLYDVVLAGIFGGIVANALLATGVAMLLGGVKFHVQKYNRENTRDLSTLLSLAIFGLLVISVIGYTIGLEVAETSPISLIVSIFLLLGYALFLLYSMKTHKDLFRSAEKQEPSTWSAMTSVLVLAGVTLTVVWVSEILSGVIENVVQTASLNPFFIGGVVVAVIGAAPEMASAVRAARNDQMDLTFSISMGGSVQIALFVAPALVILSYFLGPRPLQLIFTYEVILVLFFSNMITMQLARDGRSTWFKGALLLIVYILIAGGIFLLP